MGRVEGSKVSNVMMLVVIIEMCLVLSWFCIICYS